MLADRTAERPAPIARRCRGTGPWPCSFAQRRLWFLDQLVGSNAFYNLAAALRLPFAVDADALEGSLAEIVRRHDILHTTFTSVNGEPMQVVSPTCTFTLLRIDVRNASSAQADVEALASDFARQPFDLHTGPLFRGMLAQLAEAEFMLVLAMHHIVSDGWSAAVLARELEALYPAIAMIVPPRLPELQIQYADYAMWQQEWLSGDVLDAHVAYWREQLEHVPILQLATDRPRPPMPSFRGATVPLQLSGALLDGLRTLGRNERATVFMTLLAGFKALLFRYTGQPDVVVGAPVAGRARAELEPLIGFFVNTLVLRTDLSGNPTFRELLARVRGVALNAYAHQDLPFDRLVEELQPQRDLSRNPLFQVAFQLINPPSAPARSISGGTQTIGISKGTSVLDLSVTLTETRDEVAGTFEYATDLFDASTIARLVRHYRRVLEAMVAQPDTPISRVSLLDDEELHEIVAARNATAQDYPRDVGLLELFERVVRQVPQNIAVRHGSRALTYAELKARADNLAGLLRERGVEPGAAVAIALERSIEMVSAVLGTIKAGGCYVPLDPAYPPARIAHMIVDSTARVLVTSVALRHAVARDGIDVVLVDDARHDHARCHEPAVTNGATPDSTACVIYTSGSTGTPKGVAVPHRGINRLVINPNYISIGPGDRIAAASSFSFDAATFEIWGALLNGATLEILDRDITLAPREFAADLRRREVTVLFLTTALFNHVAATAPEAFATLRVLLFGGEIADPRSVEAVLRGGRPRHLLNVYGPTETTTFATWFEVESVEPGARKIPIGRPISSTQVYVLDERGKVVPTGVTGELFIGGDGVAQGYLNDTDLTARKFVPDPFTETPGARLYKTGDLARWRSDGTLDFIGRLDEQVKLRGFRIEPGEIEAALREHPSVRDVAVVVRRPPSRDARLDAYVVLDPTLHGDSALRRDAAQELRHHLQSRLPAFMIPAHVIVLDAFPVTANGKVDRAALPMPDEADATEARSVAPPGTPVEQTIAGIWSDLLEVKTIALHDHFFTDLGGHSLLATQVVSRLRDTFGIDLPLRRIFEAPTVSALGVAVEEALFDAVEQMTDEEVRRSLER
jgi:amino acid adenylation domain-containing protein